MTTAINVICGFIAGRVITGRIIEIIQARRWLKQYRKLLAKREQRWAELQAIPRDKYDGRPL